MLKLLFGILLEAAIGISLAGLLLAIVVPAVTLYRPAGVEGSTAILVTGSVVAAVTAAVLFRRNSAINRWRRRSTS